MIANTQRKSPWLSRKLIMTVVGVIISGLSVQYPEWREVLNQVLLVIGTYVLGESLADAAGAQRPPATLNAGGDASLINTTAARPESGGDR